jgi:glycosyltransferase involved in cell wall biosynthesis
LNNRVLYISFDGLSDPLGQSQILPYLEGLKEKGFSISVLSCEKTERLQKEKDRLDQRLKRSEIGWIHIPYREAGGLFSRYSYYRKLLSLAKKACLRNRPAFLHCRSYLAALVGLHIRARSGVPFIFDMRGFWADERIDGGIWNKANPVQNLLYNYFKAKEKKMLAAADAIVSLTRNGMKELERKFPKFHIAKRCSVIPCCVDTSVFDPATATSAHMPIAPDDHLVIYTGSVGTWYYTREMIDCLLVWRSFIPNLKLLILTRDQKALNVILKDYQKEDTDFIKSTSCSYAEVPSYLKLAKASIFFIKPVYSKLASSPTKMAECWSMNLPIITNPGIGDNDHYFIDGRGGTLVHGFTKKDYRNACEEYLHAIIKKTDYRSIALQNFERSAGVEKYLEIYLALANRD